MTARPPCAGESPRKNRNRGVTGVAERYFEEQQSSLLVNKDVPAKIDAIYFKEVHLHFEHDLCDILVKASSEAQAEENDRARCLVARKTLTEIINVAADHLEGHEVKLKNREAIATSQDGVEVLDKTRRMQLLSSFADELAMSVANTVPKIAKLATQDTTRTSEANAEMMALEEHLRALFDWKTTLTEFHQDFSLDSQRKQIRLLEEATALLDTAEPPHLLTRDVPLVSRFFIDALKRCSDQALQKRVTTCLSLPSFFACAISIKRTFLASLVSGMY